MKKIVLCFVVATILVCSHYSAHACTSFAVYSDEVIYAMNFDYYETDIRLVVGDNNGTKAFVMQFKYDNFFTSTVWMNDKGLFGSSQEQHPVEEGISRLGKDELFLVELVYHISEYNTVEEMQGFIEKKRFRQWGNNTIHTLLADIEGNAVIVEVGENGNELVPIIDDFIVMTNFKNSNFRDKQYQEVLGTGGTDRYRKAYKHILENKDNFNLDKAFEGLKMTSNSRATLCSMVFKPEENCIYVALNADFDKLWKISIDDKTIETFRGFEESLKLNIPTNGILASDLVNNNYSNYQPYIEGNSQQRSKDLYLGPPRRRIPFLTYSLFGLLLVLPVSIIVLMKSRRKMKVKA